LVQQATVPVTELAIVLAIEQVTILVTVVVMVMPILTPIPLDLLTRLEFLIVELKQHLITPQLKKS
jgi:hypothetical protein